MFEEDVFRGIPKYKENTCPLRTLVDVLKKKSTGQPTCIFEISLLSLFPKTNELIPKELFSPRRVIEYMMEAHGHTTKMFFVNPSYIEKFVYKYNSDDEEKEYVFSNKMMFYEDIIIICYLYCIMRISKSYKHKEFPLVTALARIMREKYSIFDDIYQPEFSRNKDSEITWLRIAYSYPSITLSILYHDFVDISTYPSYFFDLNFPKIFYSPLLLTLIIPTLDYTPLPLLLALAVYMDMDDKESSECNTKTSLRILWHYIYESYNTTVFPTILKLRLCEMWGIIHIVGDKYKFASYFAETYNQAFSFIKILRFCEIKHLEQIQEQIQQIQEEIQQFCL